jgi:hypothetical protein
MHIRQINYAIRSRCPELVEVLLVANTYAFRILKDLTVYTKEYIVQSKELQAVNGGQQGD